MPGTRGFDKAKLIKGRKRHPLVDTLGLLMAVAVTAASVQDRDGAWLLLSRLDGACKKLRLIWVDGGYRGQLLDWVAERTFARLNHHRRLSKDYEGQESSSEAHVSIRVGSSSHQPEY